MPFPIRYPRLDDIEDLEKYRPGGYHPVSIGDVFAKGRYKVVHKLGFGGSSTVWLARKRCSGWFRKDLGSLVTLKIMSAEQSQSSKPTSEIPDLYVPKALEGFCRTRHHPGRERLLFTKDYFSHKGPNGSHLCLISPVAGPSLSSMLECPGRVSGSRRLRADLARKAARQVATAVDLLHSAGVVHGDLTSSNILFQVSDVVHQWSDNDVYQNLGSPEIKDVYPHDGYLAPPLRAVAHIDISHISSPSLLQEDVLLIDFGQSFLADFPPPNYQPATPIHYCSPETFFESKISFASDVWALACAIFEIRAGFQLFDPFLSGHTLILRQIVETLGGFPDPWWSSWEAREQWFDETGEVKPEAELEKSSLREKLRDIGQRDDPPDADEGSMIEKTGTGIEEAEVELLADLLEKMLRYNPETRISLTEVLQHPWFAYK